MFSKNRFAAGNENVVFIGSCSVPVHFKLHATLLDCWDAVETPECVTSEGKARLLLDVKRLAEVFCLVCLLKTACKI